MPSMVGAGSGEQAGRDGAADEAAAVRQADPAVLGDVALAIYSPVLRVTFRRSMRNLARLATRS